VSTSNIVIHNNGVVKKLNNVNVFEYSNLLINEIQNSKKKYDILHVTLNDVNITNKFVLLSTSLYFNTLTVNDIATYLQLTSKVPIINKKSYKLEIMDSDTLEEQTFKDNDTIEL